MSGFLRDRRASSDNTLRDAGCRLQIFVFPLKAFLPAQAMKLPSVCRCVDLFYTADSQAERGRALGQLQVDLMKSAAV